MLSIVINVKNGARYLNQCLNSLVKFKEVILLDNHSTDNTIMIAKQYLNVKIYTSDFLGMGRVRNLAASYTSNEWLCVIDCDEVLSEGLVECLLNMQFIGNTIYKIRRYNYYDNYKLESSAWDNDWVLRVYNKNTTKFQDSSVHESLNTDNHHIKSITSGYICHFPYTDVNGLIAKMQFYSTLYATQFYNKKRPKLFMIPFRAFFMFLKCYILKRGFLDGYEGFLVSSYNAIGVFSKYIKLYELYYKKSIVLVLQDVELANINSLIIDLNNQIRLPNYVVFVVDKTNHTEITSSLCGKLVPEYKIILKNETDVINRYDILNTIKDEDVIKNLLEVNQFLIQPNKLEYIKNNKFVDGVHQNMTKNKVGTNYQILSLGFTI